MDELMQALFNHITDHLLEKYYLQTAYTERCEARDEIVRRLWEQLSPDQKTQLEQLQRAYDGRKKSTRMLQAVFW